MSDTIISYIRTYTPALAGIIIGALISWGLPVDPAAAVPLTAVLSGVFIAVYYALVRWLEHRYPWAGWLLGSPKQPSYPHVHAPAKEFTGGTGGSGVAGWTGNTVVQLPDTGTSRTPPGTAPAPPPAP